MLAAIYENYINSTVVSPERVLFFIWKILSVGRNPYLGLEMSLNTTKLQDNQRPFLWPNVLSWIRNGFVTIHWFSLSSRKLSITNVVLSHLVYLLFLIFDMAYLHNSTFSNQMHAKTTRNPKYNSNERYRKQYCISSGSVRSIIIKWDAVKYNCKQWHLIFFLLGFIYFNAIQLKWISERSFDETGVYLYIW